MLCKLAILALFPLVALAGDPSPGLAPAPILPIVPPIAAEKLPATFDPLDEAFDLRLEEIVDAKGYPEAFRYLESLQAQHPSPHAQAVYANYLLGGKSWGTSDGQQSSGVQVAIHALERGSERAMGMMGWQLMGGALVQRDFVRGWSYMQRAANSGDPESMRSFGEAYLQGAGIRKNLTLADYWFYQAAYNGSAFGLQQLADAYWSGEATGKPDPALAAKYYYDAYIHGWVPGREKLERYAKGNRPEVVKYYQLVVVWRATHGQALPTKLIQNAADALEHDYPKDPQVLTSLALLYEYGRHAGFMDYEKSAQFLQRAIAEGSLDARSQRAYLMLNGYGMKKDPAGALAEWHLLELKGNASALSHLAYHRYWGLLPDTGYTRNEAMAFYYSQRAAQAGDPFGAYNLASCYASGIGVEKNYALAAKYYHVAYKSHVLGPVGVGQSLIDRYLAFAK